MKSAVSDAPVTSDCKQTVNAALIGCTDLLEHKTCLRCHQKKSRADFGIHRRKKDGRNVHCKACCREIAKAKYYRHWKATPKAVMMQHFKKHPEQRHERKLELQRQRRATTDYDAQWRKKNRSRKAVANAKWYRSHLLEIKRRSHDKRHTESFRAYARTKAMKRYYANHSRQLEYSRSQSRKMVETLPLRYVKQLIKGKTGIPVRLIPDSLAQTWKTNLQLKRICQNQKTSTNSANNSSTPSIG